MKFDKSKILTVVTGGKEWIGKKGWFADSIGVIRVKVAECSPHTLQAFDSSSMYPFKAGGYPSSLFYPAPEHSHAERQAEWVKEHNIQVGTKVRITRDFGKDWEVGTTGHSGVAGMTGKVWGMGPHHVDVVCNQDRIVRTTPYYVLEVIKEPTYRPYNNDELNDLVGEVLTNKKSGRRKLVTGKPTEALGVNLDGSYVTAKDLLASFYHNTNETCGIKE